MAKIIIFTFLIISLLFIISCAPAEQSPEEELFGDQAVAGQAISVATKEQSVTSCAEFVREERQAQQRLGTELISGVVYRYEYRGTIYNKEAYDSCGVYAEDWSCPTTTTVRFQRSQCEENEICRQGACVNRLAEGLLGYWKLDEMVGTVADDSAGLNDGTLTGPIWAVGQVNGALEFDGSNDKVDLGTDTSLDLGQAGKSFTIAAWVKPETTSGYRAFVAKDSYTTNGRRNYWFGKNIDNLGIYFGANNPTGSGMPYYFWTTDDGLTLNAWNHVVVVWDRTANEVILYINNVRKSWRSDSSGAPYDIPVATGTHTTIGMSGDISLYPFDGSLDEVRIYNRALSASEINSLYGWR